MKSKTERGKEMSGIFQKLMDIGITLGTVTAAHMYDNDFITIEGVAHEGKKFSLTLHIMEEEKKDEGVL
jgi:hypothetical protein